MVTLIDICVLTGAGLVGGICVGLLIRNKQIKNFQDELDYLENRYSDLVDTCTECIVEKHRLQFEQYLKPIPPVKKDVVVKKKVGRPKGSTNKTKKDGGSTTRKYTRKSSK